MSRVHRARTSSSASTVSFTIARAEQFKISADDGMMAIVEPASVGGEEYYVKVNESGSLVKGYAVYNERDSKVHGAIVLSSKFRITSTSSPHEKSYKFMMADRVLDGIAVTFSSTERDLHAELARASGEHIKIKSGDINTPQIRSLVDLDAIYIFLQEELDKNFVIQSFTKNMLATGSIDFEDGDTNCLLFMLSAIHCLGSEGQKDWRTILVKKLKRKAQDVRPAQTCKKFRAGLLAVASAIGKRKRELEDRASLLPFLEDSDEMLEDFDEESIPASPVS
jgi:hypothetical protein